MERGDNPVSIIDTRRDLNVLASLAIVIERGCTLGRMFLINGNTYEYVPLAAALPSHRPTHPLVKLGMVIIELGPVTFLAGMLDNHSAAIKHNNTSHTPIGYSFRISLHILSHSTYKL